MRIRTQNLVAIVPVFLALALAAGWLTFSTARQEMLWGLQEEASSLSVAISEFIAGEDAGRDDDLLPRLESMRPAFDRILDHGQARHIFVVDRSGDVIWAAGQEREENAPFIATRETIAEAAAGIELAPGEDAVVGPVYELGSGESAMVSLAAIPGPGVEPDTRVGVVIDASRLAALSREMLLIFGRLALLAVLIGAVAAFFVSALLAKRVRALSRAALEVASGEYDREVRIGTIQELSDLSNTFNTMSSVLRDLVERTQRQLIEGEQYRTPLDLAQTYRQDNWSDLAKSYGAIQVASRSIGGGHPGDVYGLVEENGEVTIFVGRVTQGRELDSAIAAAAARRAVEFGAGRWPVERVLEEVAKLLRFRIEAVSWHPGTDEAATVTRYGEGPPSAQRVRIDEDHTILLHTFPGREGTALNRWKTVFLRMPPATLVENLARTLDPEATGTLVAIGVEPMHAALGAV